MSGFPHLRPEATRWSKPRPRSRSHSFAEESPLAGPYERLIGRIRHLTASCPKATQYSASRQAPPELLLLHAESIIVPARHDSTNLEWIQHELQSLPEPQAVAGAASLPERQQKQK